MHYRGSEPAVRDGRGPVEERGLTTVRFVGSFPAADFSTDQPRPEIAFVGRSNVGKSSLINAFLGRRALAHTSKTPGKTRLCNVFAVEDFYLVDLPGYGFARQPKGVRRGFARLLREYLSTRRQLVGVVWLLDIRRDPSPDDLAMAGVFAARELPILIAITKADKLPRGRRTSRGRALQVAVGVTEDQCILTSAKTKEGLETLRDAVRACVASSQSG